jgi:hypothetical protein
MQPWLEENLDKAAVASIACPCVTRRFMVQRSWFTGGKKQGVSPRSSSLRAKKGSFEER